MSNSPSSKNKFTHLQQKWNEFTHNFITSKNSPTTHPVFIHPRGCVWWFGSSPFIVPNMSSCAPFETSDEPLSTPPTPTSASATKMLAPTYMQESALSHNKFALCLRSILRPSSALSQCIFTTCMRTLIPSPVPACLRLLPRPSLTLSSSEFKSYMRALSPTHVPVGLGPRQAQGL